MDKLNLAYNAVLLRAIKNGGTEKIEALDAELQKNGIDIKATDLFKMTGAQLLEKNAVMTSLAVGYGKEFVEEKILMPELISRLQAGTSLLGRFNIKEMSAGKVGIPVAGARNRMTIGSETDANPTGGASAVQAATAQIELEAKELVLTIGFTDVVLEDSVISLGDYVVSELFSAFETSVHQIIINGDTRTGASTNINIIDGNTSALPSGNSTDVLLFDGARRKALANSADVNASGAVTLAHFRSACAKMGVKGLVKKDLVAIVDQDTYQTLLNITQVETAEKTGNSLNATVNSGVLEKIDGIDVAVREELGLAQAAGTVSATGSNNTKGQIAIVHAPSVYVGIRRGMTTEVSRYAPERKTAITGSARVAVTFNDVQNNVKATSSCALIRNITV